MSKVVLLNQTDASMALGITVNQFLSRKKHFKTNGLSGHKKLYKIPLQSLPEDVREDYIFSAIDQDQALDPVLEQLAAGTDFTGQQQRLDIMQARRRKIIKQTEYLQQKITAKKEQLFSQWSEKFFGVFSKNFSKFKNSLIELRLSDKQLNILTQNLEYAISNMQKSLDDIKYSYINTQQQQTDEQV